jgi:hypothetical protein
VDIFTLQDERKMAVFDISLDFRQNPHNLLALVVRQQSNPEEHTRVGDGALNVLLEKPTIEGDGFRKLLDAAVGIAAEPTTPRLAGHASLSGLARCSMHNFLA